MYTFLPIIHHELASILAAPPPAAVVEPARIEAPSWPAPPREQEVVIESKFCVIRVAKGFSRQAFTPVPKKARSIKPVTNQGQAALLDASGQAWSAPVRPAPVELKLPRRTAPRPEQTPARPVEVESLPC